MRTLLISIIFCSLAELALAATIKETWDGDGCGTKFTCYVPQKCSGTYTTTTISESKTVELSIGEEKNPNCEALIRFYVYADHSVFVSMESFDAATKSIELYNEIDSTHTETFHFSCTKSEVPENSGQWVLRGKYKQDPLADSLREITYEAIPPKIKCEFPVLLSQKNKVFAGAFNMRIKVDGVQETKPSDQFAPTLGCDPSLYKNGGEAGKSELKVYRDVKYRFGEFLCEDPEIFKMEYRLDATSPTEPFKAFNTINCENKGKIKMTPKPKPDGKPIDLAQDDLDIRCVADARFFCNEGVKTKPEKTALIHEKSDIKAQPKPKPSTLKCPDDTPHLVVREDEKPIQNVNSKLECLARGSKQLWAIERKIFLDNKEDYYCVKDLECHLQLRIAENSVINGDLDTKTFLPKCSMNGIIGILYARQGNSKKFEIEPPSCNLETGHFEYKEKGGQKQVVTEATIFECTYPEEKDTNMNMGAAETARYSAIAVGSAAVIGGGIIGIMIFFAARKRRLVKEKQKQQEEKEKKYGMDVWVRYCMDAGERANIKKKGYDGESFEEKTPTAGQEVYNWNRMLMNFQRKALECFASNKDGKILPTSRPNQELFTIDYQKPNITEYADYMFAECVINEDHGIVVTGLEGPAAGVQHGRACDGLKQELEAEDERMKEDLKTPKLRNYKLNRKAAMQPAPPGR